mgnify:CR=1 FL=1
MVILPAVDIMDGKPVRLYKGDFFNCSSGCGGSAENCS